MDGPELFSCEPFRAEIAPRQCLVNQAQGHARGELSVYWKCTTCELGKLMREANGGELPEVRLDGSGNPFVVNGSQFKGPRDKTREHRAMTAATKISRPCKNHPHRESLPGQAMCRECKRAYQREWHRKQQEKVKMAENTKEIVQDSTGCPEPGSSFSNEAQAAGDATPCRNHPERPEHKNTGFCLECNQARLANIPIDKRKAGQRRAGQRVKEAYQLLMRYEAGEIIAVTDRYVPVFDMVEGLRDFLEAAARENFRTLEAQMAFFLRETMLGEQS